MLQQRFAVARKCLVTRCEKSSQNLGCLKTSTPHTSEALKKRIVNLMISLIIDENV